MLKDLQSQEDNRNIAIDEVGICDYLMNINILISKKIYSVLSNTDVAIYLSERNRGAHMSRFVECLNKIDVIRNKSDIVNILNNIKKYCNSEKAYIKFKFTYLVKDKSPATERDCNYPVYCEIYSEDTSIYCKLIVSSATLCPCSKEISSFGAHNQRADIELVFEIIDEFIFNEVVDIMVNSASSKVYSLLKREDEKAVTEYAYSNPKFVEDVVRDLEISLKKEGIKYKQMSVKSYESIHPHNAYAMINHEENRIKR